MSLWARRTTQLILSVFATFIAVTAHASDARPLVLEHLSAAEGLPQGTVYTTLQDSQGFVWLGTEDGLVRYDGHDMYRYAYSPNNNASLPGNFVFSLAEDKHADLWIAVKGAGLVRWNRASDTFTSFRHDATNAQTISSDFVRTVLVDRHNRVWIGTLDAGVDVLDPTTGRIAHLHHTSSASESLINDEVYSLMEDRRGEVWIGTVSGIDRWAFQGGHFSRSVYLKSGEALLAGNKIEQLTDTDDGTFWIGSFESGLFHVDYTGRTLDNLRHRADDSESISSDEVHAVLDDHAGHLWIGTADGLDYLDLSNHRVGRYAHDRSDLSSLSDSFVMSLYEDGAGLLWIGTRAGGVNRWNSHSWAFGGSRPSWLGGKSVTAFADAVDGHVWVGTLGAGLFDVDIRTGDATSIDTLLRTSNALGDRRAMSLLRDRRGDLWIGTLAAGLKKLSADGRLTSIPVHVGDAHALSAAGVAVIYESKSGRLWIGTHGGGANVLDPVTGTVHQIPFLPSTPGSTSSSNVTSFTEDLNGNVWIGTENGGVDIASPDGAVFKVFGHDIANPHSLPANVIYALATDGDGRIWIATEGGGLGLVVGSSVVPDAIEFQTISLSEGLSSDTIYAVVPDAKGSLWLSGNAGLMRFDPVTHAVKTYHREHGLQGEEFNSGAYLRTADGRLCFGGPNGFNIFRPDQLPTASTAPRIALTSVEVLGAPVHEKSPYWLLHEIPLDYRASVVSFDFAALDYTSPARNRLSYRMTGLTDKWIDLNSQRRVTLTNLDAGDHILEVRAANADSIWSTEPFRLVIHKQAAPWRSKTAYGIYAVILIALILTAIQAQRLNLGRALASKQALESEVALRTRELREANQQLMVASEAKSDFLSRMGHELRTPMNGVVGMAELIARSPLSLTQARQIQTIRSSARTLLQILNDLLDLSKAQAGKIELECLSIDLNSLIEESVATFAGAAESKGLNLIVCPLLDERNQLFGDPLRVQQILMNLIGNAVKFTERGEVVVTCDTSLIDQARSHIVISVADTGIGIANGAVARVFEPFSQADETTTRRFGGTGLGLSICQELARLMGGTIRVESQPLGGSTFTVSVPFKVAAKQVAAGTELFSDKTMIIMTRRRALWESLRRHANLIGATSRYVESPAADLALGPDDVLFLDADSCPDVLNSVLNGQLGRQTIIIASSATLDAQLLESEVQPAQILRSPLERATLCSAMLAVFDPVPRGIAASPKPAALPAFSAHVLIVEDDSVNAAVAEGYLKELGCSSAWVTNGASAISRSSVERFDLILMDLNMPGLDGYATAQHIREVELGRRRVPIVALTANNAAAYREHCLSAGMDDILTKPYTLAECAGLLQRWVDHKAAPLQRAAITAQHQSLTTVDSRIVADLQHIGGASAGVLYSRLVSLFEQNLAEALMKIGSALAAGKFDAARALAHKIKGGAANVGALSFAARLGELESTCLSKRTAAQGLFEALLSAQPGLIAELRQRALKASA